MGSILAGISRLQQVLAHRYHEASRRDIGLLTLFGSTAVICTPLIRLWLLRRRLAPHIRQQRHIGADARAYVRATGHRSSLETRDIESVLPAELLASPESFRIFHDSATFTRSSHVSQPPSTNDGRGAAAPHMLIRYLRRAMTLFHRTPQAFILHRMTPKHLQSSWSPSYLATCDFKPGDAVNGLYEVCYRRLDPGVGVCGFKMVQGKVEGRLIITVETARANMGEREKGNLPDESGEGKMVRITSETYMWTQEGEAAMPMDRAIPRFAHETTSWWLMERASIDL